MEWNEWVGKIVFVKLSDGQVYSHSEVISYEEPFMALKDKFGLPAIINVNSIIKISEENNNEKRFS